MFYNLITNNPDSKLAIIYRKYISHIENKNNIENKNKQKSKHFLVFSTISSFIIACFTSLAWPKTYFPANLWFDFMIGLVCYGLYNAFLATDDTSGLFYPKLLEDVNSEFNNKEDILVYVKELENIQNQYHFIALNGIVASAKEMYLSNQKMSYYPFVNLINFMIHNYEEVKSPQFKNEDITVFESYLEKEVGNKPIKHLL